MLSLKRPREPCCISCLVHSATVWEPLSTFLQSQEEFVSLLGAAWVLLHWKLLLYFWRRFLVIACLTSYRGGFFKLQTIQAPAVSILTWCVSLIPFWQDRPVPTGPPYTAIKAVTRPKLRRTHSIFLFKSVFDSWTQIVNLYRVVGAFFLFF